MSGEKGELAAIGDAEATLTDVWTGATWTSTAETVVLNTVRTSDRTLGTQLAAAGIEAEHVGDCLAPREVDDAIYEGMACGSAL